MGSSKEKGYSLIELMIVIAIASSFALVATQQSRIKHDRLQAQAIGHEILQYNAAVGRYIMSSPAPEGVIIHHDGHWLRSSECNNGTADYHFLPCHYFSTGKTVRGGVGVTTSLHRYPSGEIIARTVFDPIVDLAGRESDLMMSLAATIASTSSSVTNGEIRGGMTYYCSGLGLKNDGIDEICGEQERRLVSIMTSTEAVGLNLPSMLNAIKNDSSEW